MKGRIRLAFSNSLGHYGTMLLSEVLNNPAKPMGHGLVLAMLLTNDAALSECKLR
jgi:hypothetical protein